MMFNKQGRTVSDSMRMKAFLRDCQIKAAGLPKWDYRGFEISGRSGRYYVESCPTVFTSKKAAHEQVDRCLELRALLAEEA